MGASPESAVLLLHWTDQEIVLFLCLFNASWIGIYSIFLWRNYKLCDLHLPFLVSGPDMALRPGTRSLLDNSIGVSDACLLDPIDEDNFVENLQLRFQRDRIYVSNNN